MRNWLSNSKLFLFLSIRYTVSKVEQQKPIWNVSIIEELEKIQNKIMKKEKRKKEIVPYKLCKRIHAFPFFFYFFFELL